MTQKLARTIRLGICILILASLFSWPKPVSAALGYWSAEVIPSTSGNMLGPAGVDIRDFTIASDNLKIYAVPGDSIANNLTYKSTDGGTKWTVLSVPIRADFVAIAPDDNTVVIANNYTPTVYYSTDDGFTWSTLGPVQELPGGAPPLVITDLAISPAKNNIHYIVVAGKEAGYIANLWYLELETVLPTWHETRNFVGFVTDNETATFTFSPSFTTDATLIAVTDSAGIGAGVRVQMLNIENKMWNWNDVPDYTNFPYTIVNNAGINQLTSASLALDPDYAGNAPSTFRSFIGLTVDGDISANATSGIYRLVNIIQSTIMANYQIHSLAFDGSELIAGSYNATTVYQITNPYAVLPKLPKITTSDITKSPGGDDKTLVAWLGGNIIAGTSGDESAFAKSEGNSIIFNDISLIDTAITKAKDVAVSPHGSKIYLISEHGSDTSLWCYDSVWRRVLNPRGKIDFIVRISPVNSSVVYLAQRGTPLIYYNGSSGRAPWLSYTNKINAQDMTVESSDVIYVIDASGVVSKSIDKGILWANTGPTGLTSGSTVVSVGTKIVLVGSQDGYVAYSYDGAVSWTKIEKVAQPGSIQVIADQNFATNKIIYAATNTPGGNIMKWTIGKSTNWLDIFDGVILGGIYGLAITSNVLYALEYNAAFASSTLWRLLSPADAEESSDEWTSNTAFFVILNSAPQALKASLAKLWAVKTSGTNMLYSYTDLVIDVTIDLKNPEEGYRVPVNYKTGLSYDIYFSWGSIYLVTGYELVIAEDENFSRIIARIPVNPENTLDPIVNVIVGPNQTGATYVNFTPARTYYWKVRTVEPSYSLYSEIRYFTIEPEIAAVLQVITLVQGEITSTTNVTLSWLPIQETTEYQFRLDDELPMTSPIIDILVNTTAITLDVTLEYGVTYFWQVRSTKPIRSDWSEVGTFYVVEGFTTPPVVKAPPETTTLAITAPPATEFKFSHIFSTPVYIPVAIFITIILLAAVIFFIDRRRPIRINIPLPRKKQPIIPAEKYQIPGAAPTRPEVKPEPQDEIPEAPAPPEKITPHPTIIEKDKNGATAIFAAKSFIWMVAQGIKTEDGQGGLTEKERRSLGKNLAAKIHDLARKENLYIKYPNDVAMLLSIWAEYGSKNETSDYLTRTFELNPFNAIKLLKIYLPAVQPGMEPPTAADFTMAQYNKLTEVIDPDNVYAALSKVFKFQADTIEERVPVTPEDRDLASQFMRLHFQAKGEVK